MPEQKMIPCPECDATGEVCVMGINPDSEEVITCYQCDGNKAIPDRRAPSAAEAALRAELKAARDENQNIHITEHAENKALRAEVARLQAELVKYTGPLTDEREVYSDKALLRDALHNWGLPSQLAMVAEEAAELAVAAMHMLRDQHHNKSGAPDDFCSEMADVEIMIDQMKVAGYADKIAEFKASKMVRLGMRLDAAIREVRGK